MPFDPITGSGVDENNNYNTGYQIFKTSEGRVTVEVIGEMDNEDEEWNISFAKQFIIK